MDRKEFRRRTVIVSIAALILIIATYMIYNKGLLSSTLDEVKSISAPFVIGFALAYIILPLCKNTKKFLDKITNNKLKNSTLEFWSIAVGELAVILLIVFIGIIVLPELVTSIAVIIEQIPGKLKEVQVLLDGLARDNEWVKKLIGGNTDDLINNIMKSFSNNIEMLSTKLFNGIAAIFSGVLNIVLGLFISMFVLASREKLARQSKNVSYAVLGKERAENLFKEVRLANEKFMGFFVGKIVDSLIIGIICFIALLIMKMPYAGLISFIVGITNIVPIVGPFIGAVPGAIMVFSISPIKSLYFIIFILVLQQLDGNYIGPKCIGNSVNLNTFYVLTALLIFGGIWGMVGMIIGVPLFAVVYDIIKRKVNSRIKSIEHKE